MQVMDWSKYPIEKVFFFVAGMIPGFLALLIYHLAAPNSFHWFFTLGFLGYKMKLAAILVTAFVVGNSMTTFLSSLLGMTGGIVGTIIGQKPFKPSHTEKVAPWRDVRWRARAHNRLGAQAPNDSLLVSEELATLRRQVIDTTVPANQCPQAHAALNLEKINTEIDDARWAQWYDHYHQIVFNREIPDVRLHIKRGLDFNLETAGLYILVSAIFVPTLRRWWCILPSALWGLLLFAFEYAQTQKWLNKWSTLEDQIKYLSEER